MSKKFNADGWERVSQVADLGFQIYQQWPKNAFFFATFGA